MENNTEEGWKKIFEKYPILKQLDSNGFSYITANEIHKASGREPRLMTKFDTRESRPSSLNNVSILAVENGKYALLRSDCYHDVESTLNTETYVSDKLSTIQTLPWAQGFTTESQVLDASFVLSLLQKVTRDKAICLTIRGRQRSPDFSFNILTPLGTHQLSVSGVQIEVDGGYEGDRVYLIETKMGTRENFNGRQLYYPYRMWKEIVKNKEIIPIFLMYSNKTFSFRLYKYVDDHEYNSLKLVKSQDYILDQPKIIPSIGTLIIDKRIQPPIGVPFPQADDIRKVIDLVDAVVSGHTTQLDLSKRFEYEPRQADYYGNAAVFLGLVDRKLGGFKPNNNSMQFIRKSPSERLFFLISHLSTLPVFSDAIRNIFSGKITSRDSVAENVSRFTGLNENTSNRRALTVESWVNWLKQTYDLFQAKLV